MTETHRLVLLACLAHLFCQSVQAEGAASPAVLRVMSFNMRFDTPSDGENAWPHRKDTVASMIRCHRADIAGLQQALEHQNDNLAQRLADDAWFGVGFGFGDKGLCWKRL